MKILWTTNTLSPIVAKQIGVYSSHPISWVEAMSEYIKKVKNVQMAIACPCNVPQVITKKIDDITYCAVPDDEKNWRKLILNFKPNVIHGFGTEKKHNLIVSTIAEKSSIPMIVSLQGILSEYQRHYYGGIDISTILKYTLLRDIVRPSGFISGRRDFVRRSKQEIQLIKKIKYVEGRSTWDRVSVCNINDTIEYFYCSRMLRKEFHSSLQWSLDGIKRHTIFVAQGNYPIKGVHFAFEALAKLKNKYPDAKIIVTGDNMFEDMSGMKKYFKPGYRQYLFDLSKSLKIRDSIIFTGSKSAAEMAKLYATVNVAVIPSAIENAPNSLAEAMLIGTPCVASFVGGNMDMLEHNKEGFLYCYNEPNMLAEYISRIFDSDDLANTFSAAARNRALKDHSPEMLVDTLLNIYNSIVWRENS